MITIVLLALESMKSNLHGAAPNTVRSLPTAATGGSLCSVLQRFHPMKSQTITAQGFNLLFQPQWTMLDA